MPGLGGVILQLRSPGTPRRRFQRFVESDPSSSFVLFFLKKTLGVGAAETAFLGGFRGIPTLPGAATTALLLS
jgi:hypothetical protein